jgi:hypothetical protein
MRHIAGTLLIMLALIFASSLLMAAGGAIVYALRFGIEPLHTWLDPLAVPIWLGGLTSMLWLGAVLSRPRS